MSRKEIRRTVAAVLLGLALAGGAAAAAAASGAQVTAGSDMHYHG